MNFHLTIIALLKRKANSFIINVEHTKKSEVSCFDNFLLQRFFLSCFIVAASSGIIDDKSLLFWLSSLL